MSRRIVALHGFLGQGSDWAAVRAATPREWDWICPDLFAPGQEDWRGKLPEEGKSWLVGYSFGGRLALRLLEEDQQRWHGALLLSVNPGNFQSEDERRSRRLSDAAWAAAFREDPWEDVVKRWNRQGVFSGGCAPTRAESSFDRGKLACALEDYSVASQFADTARLGGTFVWVAGGEDKKFCTLLHAMRQAGFPGTFFALPGAGHRLLQHAPAEVAAALDRLAG